MSLRIRRALVSAGGTIALLAGALSCSGTSSKHSPDGGATTTAAAALDGMRVELPCTQNVSGSTCDTSASAEVRRTMNGTVGTLYSVRLRVRGVIEEKTYREGLVLDGTDTLMVSGGDVTSDASCVYTLDVDDPPQTLYLNRGTSLLTYCIPVDYEATLTLAAGAHVTLTAQPVSGVENRNLDDTDQPLVLASSDVAPYPQAFNGQFVQLNVLDAEVLPAADFPARTDAVVFDGADARRAVNGADWAPTDFKNECGPEQALVGLSGDPVTHQPHAILCSSDEPSSFTRGTCRGVEVGPLDGGADDGGVEDGGPGWDPGYLTGGCDAGEFVAGLAVDPTSLGATAVTCCSELGQARGRCTFYRLPALEAPDAGVVDAGDLDAGVTDAGEIDGGRLDGGFRDAGPLSLLFLSGDAGGDWDVGFAKVECPAGQFVTSVSRDPDTGAVHAIECCGG